MSLVMGFRNLSMKMPYIIVLTGYGLCVERQKDISVFFRGKVIGDFKADLIVNEKISVMISVDLWLNSYILRLSNLKESRRRFKRLRGC